MNGEMAAYSQIPIASGFNTNGHKSFGEHSTHKSCEYCASESGECPLFLRLN